MSKSGWSTGSGTVTFLRLTVFEEATLGGGANRGFFFITFSLEAGKRGDNMIVAGFFVVESDEVVVESEVVVDEVGVLSALSLPFLLAFLFASVGGVVVVDEEEEEKLRTRDEVDGVAKFVVVLFTFAKMEG